MEREVGKRWQPRIRAKAKKKAVGTDGIVVSARARFVSPPPREPPATRTSDRITPALSPRWAEQLFEARDQGATEQALLEIAAQGLGEMYFRDNGRRAHHVLASSPTWRRSRSTSDTRVPVGPHTTPHHTTPRCRVGTGVHTRTCGGWMSLYGVLLYGRAFVLRPSGRGLRCGPPWTAPSESPSRRAARRRGVKHLHVAGCRTFVNQIR
ncbi:hypothetical protein AB0O64_30140 [Streptomyces sp. NPDC088341]|uniref:telomere-protecting terminal protein Tpg n=1 Tax=Streptomyces sp. NPDC088341 TaxID=3154870 RepID=UPI003431E0DF